MKKVSLEKATGDLVVRARAGDQNAMGMIDAVRRSAAKGSPRAKQSVGLIQKYIEAHPIRKPKTTMGAEAREAIRQVRDRGPVVALYALLVIPLLGGAEAIRTGAVALANGPRIDSKRVSAIGAGLTEHERKYFYTGVHWHGHDGCLLAQVCPAPGEKTLVHAGRCVGLARAIQEVRKPNSQIGLFHRLAGWEHGEEWV